MLLEGTLLVPEADRSVELRRGFVLLDGDTIAQVGFGKAPGEPDLGGDGVVICPGFVDTHVHLPQFDSIGAFGLSLLEWLEQVIFPAEARWEDAAHAEAMTQRVVRQLLAAGTTAAAAYATVHHTSAQAALNVMGEAGFRGCVGQVLMDREAPEELIRPAAQLLREAESLRSHGRVDPSVVPRFAVSCTPELLQQAGALAQKTGWIVQTHLAETQAELELVGRLFGGEEYTRVYERCGLLGSRSVLAHGIHLSQSELALLAKSDSIIAHCPTANVFLASGQMQRSRLHAAGVRTTLGSDVAGGPDRSMVRVARSMIETAQAVGRDVPSPAECFWQITRGNADALGWSDAGRLQEGASADLLMVTPDIVWETAPDPLGALLYGWDDRWLDWTLVEGGLVYPML